MATSFQLSLEEYQTLQDSTDILIFHIRVKSTNKHTVQIFIYSCIIFIYQYKCAIYWYVYRQARLYNSLYFTFRIIVFHFPIHNNLTYFYVCIHVNYEHIWRTLVTVLCKLNVIGNKINYHRRLFSTSLSKQCIFDINIFNFN